MYDVHANALEWKSAFFYGQRARGFDSVSNRRCVFSLLLSAWKNPGEDGGGKKKRSFPRANVTTCFFVFRSSLEIAAFPFPPHFSRPRIDYATMTSSPGNFDLRPNQPQLVGTYRPIYIWRTTPVAVCGRVTRRCPGGQKTTGGKKTLLIPPPRSKRNVRISRALVWSRVCFLRFARFRTKCRPTAFCRVSHYTRLNATDGTRTRDVIVSSSKRQLLDNFFSLAILDLK